MDYGTIGGSHEEQEKAGPRWLNRLALLYALEHLPPEVPETILSQTILDSEAMDWFGYAEALAEAVALCLVMRWPGVSLTATGRQTLEKLTETLHITVRKRIKDTAAVHGKTIPQTQTRSAHYVPRQKGALCRFGLYKDSETQWHEVLVLNTQAARDACREWMEKRL